MELGLLAAVISVFAFLYGAIIAIILTRAIYRSLANVPAPVQRLLIVIEDRRPGKTE